jgi:hypothetical protein
MTHGPKKQSTGSYKGAKKDKHESGPQKGLKEKKREHPSWKQKKK